MMQYIIGAVLVALILFLWVWGRNAKNRLRNQNEELKSLYKKSEEQYQIQKEYISVLSQELRIPLYGIMGLTNLLVEGYPELKNDKRLKSLKFSGDYLLTLINTILHVNYLDSEEITTQQTSFNLQEITQNLVNSFSYATESSDNVLHFDYDHDLNELMLGDPAILTQILMNLISNALRFTVNGNVYFSVNKIKKKEHTNTISFRVSHDGYEVSKEEEKSIFQEFMNVETAKKTYLGTGLNSTIVHKLAKAINGEIIIQNNTNTGSEYALVVDFDIFEQHTKSTISTLSIPAAETSQKPKALIVDDNKLNLLVADKMLSSENFDCTTVNNGFDAIELVRDNKYNIILMDINMPKLNGIGTTKRIREFDLVTPIIALTAVDVTQLNRQIIQAGLNDYILKPYNKNHLLEIIDKHIHLSKN